MKLACLLFFIISLIAFSGCIGPHEVPPAVPPATEASVIDGYKPLIAQGKDFLGWGGQVLQTRDGGYIVYGYGESSDPELRRFILLLKIDANGNLTWAKRFSLGEFLDVEHSKWESYYPVVALSLTQIDEGGYLLNAHREKFFEEGHGIVIETDEDGDIICLCEPQSVHGRMHHHKGASLINLFKNLRSALGQRAGPAISSSSHLSKPECP
jgi:hypothetical protein